MGEVGAFLKIERVGVPYRDPAERAGDYEEFLIRRSDEELAAQGARCMECGVPFCHNGCPLGNLIPDWNDLVYQDNWADAIRQLHATNNFPEFTGRLCPAPCEAACVLEIHEGDEVRCGVEVGRDVTVSELREDFDAVVLATGSRVPRDLPAPGRELEGIHFAMDYLYGRNRWVADESFAPPITAAG